LKWKFLEDELDERSLGRSTSGDGLMALLFAAHHVHRLGIPPEEDGPSSWLSLCLFWSGGFRVLAVFVVAVAEDEVADDATGDDEDADDDEGHAHGDGDGQRDDAAGS